MDPIIATAVSVLVAAVSAGGVFGSFRRFVQAVLGSQERAGRSVTQVFRDALTQTEPPATEPTLEERIQSLSKTMAESARLLAQVSAEIELRATFAKQKQEEAEIAIAAATLNGEQLAALQRVVRVEVGTEGNRGLRAGMLTAAFTFVLGIAGTILVTLFVHPLR